MSLKMQMGGPYHTLVLTWTLLQIGYLVGGVTSSSNQLFDAGKEYKYTYFGLFTTGTEEPISYASTYMLIGKLIVQGNAGNVLTAKLEDMKMAMYNGRWQYFPIPQFGFFGDERLSTLEEPFKIVLTEEGKFKTLIMNDQEPEYASNMKRGLATYLQMNLTDGLDSIRIFKEQEMTTMGECLTAYEVIPVSTSSKFVRLGKFRNHADCPDIPSRTRFGTRGHYKCATDKTRDILNSTSYATYELELDGTNPTISKVTIFSSVLYWPFTSAKQYLYTWFNVTLSLTEVGPIQTPLLDPENSETHEDLAFVFEQSDYQDDEETPDVKTVEPFYFHQTASDTEPETMEALIGKVKDAIDKVLVSFNTKMDEFAEDFHSNSPLDISKAIFYLDYDSLTLLYRYYSAQSDENADKQRHLQLYIDGLVNAGTSATTIVLRDIIVENYEKGTHLARILPLFPHYIRTPSENLVKEFDITFDLLKNTNLNHTNKRMLEFSLASLISRGCERNLCATSGILDKYITYFEKKFKESTHFSEQTTAVLGLRNLQIGESLNTLLDIAVGNIVTSNIVRVQAIWSLQPLFYRKSEMATQTLLQVFYNRTEPCEIRTSTFGLMIGSNPKQQILHEIAYYMWSETCPQTLNIVRSTLTHMSKATGPCSKISSNARTILKYLPPGPIDPTRTTSYAMGYFDENIGFGRSWYMNVQKSGSTALPTSVYIGSSYTMGGYAGSPLGIFIRMEGLGKFIPKNMLSSPDAETPEKILKVLSHLNVKTKTATPLKLEFTVLYLNRAIYHYAADEEILRLSIGKGAKKAEAFMRTLKNSTSFNNVFGGSFLLGETLYEQPLEVGFPISIYISGVMTSQLRSNITFETQGQNLGTNFDTTLRSNIFVTTTISNHVPVFGTANTAGLLRTVRLYQPHRFGFLWDLGKYKLDKVTVYPAPAENPFATQIHATSFTLLSSDQPIATDAVDLLNKSCPNCSSYTLASSGPGIAQTNEIFSIPRLTNGMRSGVKKVMCETNISKTRIFQGFKNLFDTREKNTGLFDTIFAKFILGYQQGFDYLVLWPHPEPCGFQLYESKNYANSSHVLEKIEGSVSFDVELGNKNNQPQLIRIDENITLTFEGTSAPPQQLWSVHLEFSPEVEGEQRLSARLSVDGQKDGNALVVCFEVKNHASVPQSDPLGFSGDNEPTVNQSVVVKVGKVLGPVIGNADCPNDQVDISIFADAERSHEQVVEANGQSHDLSYLLCQLDQQSGNWPKNVMPPTMECFQVTLDQTGLRKANLSVKYKVATEVRKRWARPLILIGNLLSPFLVDPEQDKVHHNQQLHHEYEGQLEIGLNLKKQDPTMNIHFVGATEERYYQDIDLNLLPNAISLQPAPSRFSPSTQFLYKAGFLGSCALTPSTIATFDNQKYAVNVSSDCETLVVADCSEWPDFVVYAKTTANKKLSVRVAVWGSEFEIVNDKVTFINSPEHETVAFDDTGSFAKHHLKMKKKVVQGRSEITVKWRVAFGIKVRYSGGDFIQVILSSRYRGMTCGLCGNFDTSPQNDIRGPTAASCPLSSISQAWTVKSESCEKSENVC